MCAIALTALSAAPARAQGDLVANYKGLVAGRSLFTDGFFTLRRSEHAFYLAIESSPSQSASYTLRLPTSAGSAGECLKASGGGVSTWQTCYTLTGALLAANNLSELSGTAATARSNLGLGTLATQDGTFSGTSSGTNTGDQDNIIGNAGTATALAADGANCSAGQFPLGVDAAGAAQSCTALPTTIAGTANQIAASASTGGITLSIPTNPTLPGTTTGTFSGNLTGNVTGNVSGTSGSTTGNAATVTTNANLTGPITSVGNATTVADAELAALAGLTSAADKIPYFSGLGTAALADLTSAFRTFLTTSSSANLRSVLTDEVGTGAAYFVGGALGTPASGTATNLTGTASGLTAGAATALSANGTNCSAGSAPLGVDASGNAETCTAYQTADTDLATIAGLTATTDNFLQAKASAWASRTPAQVAADLPAMVGDSGAGGTKGLVPGPAAGDAAAGKVLKADGTWGNSWITPQAVTLTGPTAARTYAIRDANDTIATLGATQTLSGTNTFSGTLNVSTFLNLTNSPSNFDLGGSNNIGGMSYRTTMTPDAGFIYAGPTPNALHVAEANDIGFDFNNGACGTSSCADPAIVFHTAVQDKTQYNHVAAWGRAGGPIKALTESSPINFLDIPIANLAGGDVLLHYRTLAADATDSQVRGGLVRITLTAKGGTPTCTMIPVGTNTSDSSITELEDGSGSGAITAGTLTTTLTCGTTTNLVELSMNAISSLTQTTFEIQYTVSLVGPGQPARQ